MTWERLYKVPAVLTCRAADQWEANSADHGIHLDGVPSEGASLNFTGLQQ
jgi:hypothetical protein